MKEIIWINGRIVGRKEAKISIFDHGFLYGDGFFETMRGYNGKVFRIDEHMARLFAASRILKIKIPHNRTFLKNNISKLVTKLKSKNAYVRIAVTRGEGKIGLNPALCKKANVILRLSSFNSYPESYYKKGIKAAVSSVRRNNYSPLSSIKSNNYLNNILALMEAKKKGKDEAIMLNTDGFVAGSTTSNIFMVKGARLITPGTKEGLLPGITRSIIVKLASTIGLKVKEGRISISALKKAEEVFLTNSIGELRGIVKVDNTKISEGKVGPVTGFLHGLYRALVKKELKI